MSNRKGVSHEEYVKLFDKVIQYYVDCYDSEKSIPTQQCITSKFQISTHTITYKVLPRLIEMGIVDPEIKPRSYVYAKKKK